MPRKARIDAPGAVHHIICRQRVGMSATEIAKRLGITQPAVSKAVPRGEKLALENSYELVGG